MSLTNRIALRTFRLITSPRFMGGCLVLGCLFLQQYRFYDFFIDDSYISLVYVKNWLEGNGLTYNGLVVEGYSNFLWVIALCGIGLFQIDLVFAAKLLGIISSVGVIVAVTLLGHTLTQRWREGLLAALLLTVSGPFIAWSVGGLETCLFTLLLVLLAFYLVGERATPHRWPLSIVWAVMLALTRPEGIGLVAIAGAWLLFNAIRNDHAPRIRGSLRWLCVVAGAYGIFLLWRYLRYGDILPSTVYAKSGLLHDQLYAARMRLGPLLREWWLLVGSFVIGTISCLWLLREARHAVWLLLMLLGAYSGFVVLSGADWMPMHRFVVPLLPFIALITVCGLGKAMDLIPYSSRPHLHGLLLAIALAPCLFQGALWTEQHRADAIAAGRSSFEPNIALGQMIRAHATAQTRIAVIDAGALAYYSGVPTLDLYGLNNHYIARLPGGFGTRFDAAYVLTYAPTLIVTHYETTPSGLPRFVSFDPMYKLYYMREFQRWYEPDPTLPFAPFHRLEHPKEHTSLDAFYKSSIRIRSAEHLLHAGQQATFHAQIGNTGTGIWRSASKLELGAVYLRVQLFNAAIGQQVAEQWTPLPHDVAPGQAVDVTAHMTLPRGTGSYKLRADLVLNGVSYFAEQGDSAAAEDVSVD